MIKCDYFGKLLKPLFSILLIGFFGLSVNSFVNAGKVQMIGIEGYPSIYNTQYQLTFLKGGGVLTNYLGQGKSVLGLNSDAFFWWSTNGLPYFYGPYSQGFFDTYCACDVMSDYDWIPENANCTCNPMTGDFKQLFKGFFSNVKQYDLAYYDYDQIYNNYPSCTQKKYQGKFCWSSSGLNSSLCIVFSDLCFDTCYHSMCNGLMGGSLVNSQGLQNLTYGLISNSWIGYAPGQNGYNGEYEGNTEGSVDVNIDNTYTGDYTYTECTNGSIMNYAEKSGISPYLCQGGLDNWDLLSLTGIYNSVPGSGKRLDEIYGYTTNSGQINAKDWFNYRQPIYINQYVGNQNAWLNQPAVLRSYFKIYNDYGGQNFDFNTVYEYCLMRKFYTWDNSYATHKYQGQYFNKTCTYIQNNQISNSEGGNAGESIIGLNWNGVGNLSGGKTYNDPGQFIIDMFTKIKSYIPTDKSDIGLGFLPTYIITFMVFLILFRFLSH